MLSPDELVEVQAADFLFAFEKHLDVQRQSSGLLHVRFDRLEVHEDLAFVVGGAPRVELAFANGRLERRRFPELERVDRLNVVVAVEEDGGRAGSVQPFAVDDRIAGGLDQAHVLEADRLSCDRRSTPPPGEHRPDAAGSALTLGIARYCFSSSM